MVAMPRHPHHAPDAADDTACDTADDTPDRRPDGTGRTSAGRSASFTALYNSLGLRGERNSKKSEYTGCYYKSCFQDKFSMIRLSTW